MHPETVKSGVVAQIRVAKKIRCSVLRLLVLPVLLASVGSNQATTPAKKQRATNALIQVPAEDVRLKPEFLFELVSYKKDFKLPAWAKQGRARQIRFDGGPMFAACQFESGWKYLTDPKTPGFVGMIKSVWTLTNLYTDNLETRLDEIRAAGYNWVWVSYQLGYAFDDEARQRAQVRRLIEFAHARDIRVTAYFSLTSVFTNSAFLGNPESRNWIQESPDGSPVAYSGIPVRLMACVNKPGRIDYLKKIVQLAVKDGADDIFWDSIFNHCYCAYCERGFHEYSRRILGKAYPIPSQVAGKDKKQFGIEENYDFSVAGKDTINGLFTEYGHYAAARAIAELDRYAKSLNHKVLVSANSHRFRYVDDVTDITWSEDSNRRGARIDEKGGLTTPIGVYAWCQAIAGGKKPIQLTVAPDDYWQVQPPEYYKLTVAEAASFQANFVMLASYAFGVRFDDRDPVAKLAWNGISAGLGFAERHENLFEDASPLADIALYYSFPSRIHPDAARESGGKWQEAMQAFLLAGIPARIVTDQSAVQMGAKKLLAQARMVILLGTSCMSDEEIKTLKEYVGLGGILMVTPDSSSYTSFWTKRRDSPWNKDNPFIRIVEEKDLLSPEIVTVMTRSLLNRPPWIEIQGNGYQLANPTTQTGRLVIHVLNYDRDRSFRNLKVAISVRGYEARSANALDRNSAARWLTPDSPSEEQLPIVWSGDRAEIRIPLLEVSGLLVISPKDER